MGMNILDTPRTFHENKDSYSLESLRAYIMDRKYSNASVNRAGDYMSFRNSEASKLLDSDVDEWGKRFDEAFDIMSDWRSLHAAPMKAISLLLSSEASRIDGQPIVVERLKRYRSIRLKLQRFPVTNLTTMQDIAGCRAVVQDISHAYELNERIIQRLNSDAVGPQIIEKWCRDYIGNPKSDGYRSIHHVAKFFSSDPDHAHCNGLRVEIQIRSRLQHAWAMAVETASAVTNQALKSGEGQEQWKRFFLLVAEIMAANEGTSSSIKNATEHASARKEATDLAVHLRVVNLLSAMQHVLESYSTFEDKGSSTQYLLVLNSLEREITYVGYAKDDFKKAAEAYAEKERENKDDADINVVLVSAESLQELKSAYPSYFLDSVGFIDLIRDQVFGSAR